MFDDRDMYYGYGGYVPMNNMGMSNPMTSMGMSNPSSSQMQMMPNNYSTSQFNDMNERINRF